MEFKFRAVDDRRGSFTSQSSDYSYFTEQALRGDHIVRYSHAGSGIGNSSEYYHNPIEIHAATWRELEKERIREELLAKERYILEQEVRRELMVERELARRRGYMMRFEPRGFPAPPLPHRADGRSTLYTDKKLRMHATLRCDFGGLDSRSLHPEWNSVLRISEPRITEVIPSSEICEEKPKIIVLAKPEQNLPGGKRKAETPPLVTSGDLKKKVKQEWSCALCQLSVTSEQLLNDHLQGKKHKAKEAGLRKKEEKFSVGLYPKNPSKSDKLVVVVRPNSNQGSKKQAEKSPLASCRDLQPADDLKEKVKEWKCTLCQVRVRSEGQVNEHLQGKKHKVKESEALKNKKSHCTRENPKNVVESDKLEDIGKNPNLESPPGGKGNHGEKNASGDADGAVELDASGLCFPTEALEEA